MKTVLQIIEEAGGLATLTWTRIESPPFMLLVIESLGEQGPNGHGAFVDRPLRRAEWRRYEGSGNLRRGCRGKRSRKAVAVLFPQ